MNITETSIKLKNFFRNSNLYKIAKETGFIKRERKIKASDFVKNLMFTVARDGSNSLDYITSLFYEDDICLSKQALNTKINKQGAEFLKIVFERLYRQFICINYEFNDIIVVDSSEIKMNKKLKDFQNKQNGPRCKIQACLRLLSNSLHCEVTKANRNDQGYKEYLKQVKYGDLLIVDLGYFSLESFKEIMNKGAYFISRFLTNTVVMDKEFNVIELAEILKNSRGHVDMDVIVGKESKVSCRIVAKKLEGECLKRRLDKLDRDARRSGKKIKANREVAFWSIYITNLKEEPKIHELYSLRWQIELLFKVLKSKLSMGYISDDNPNKAMVMIYSKLICMTVAMILLRGVGEVELSLYKAIDYYKDNIRQIYAEIVTGKLERIKSFLIKVKKFAQKSQRKSRLSSLANAGLKSFFSSA